mgnify:CR=1 FL=1
MNFWKYVGFATLAIVSTAGHLYGQGYTNKHTTFAGLPGSAITHDKQYIYHVAGAFEQWNAVDFVKLDYNGNLIKHNRIVDSVPTALISTSANCLDIVNHNLYALVDFRRDSNFQVLMPLTILKLNDDLRLKKRLELFGNKDTSFQAYDLKFDTDSTFLVSGLLYHEPDSFSFKWDMYVARFDTALNLLWQTIQPDTLPQMNNGYKPRDITLDAYGSIIVSGEAIATTNSPILPAVEYSFAARLNRLTGEVKWVRHYYLPPFGNAELFTHDRGDGHYYFTQSIHVEPNPSPFNPGHIAERVRFGIMDSNGRVVSDTSYGSFFNNFVFRDMMLTHDGNFYLAGIRASSIPPFDWSAGFKVSPQGDSLWFRRYYFLNDSTDITDMWCYTQLPDSSLVHMGLYVDWDNDINGSRRQYGWFLKTDRYGCMQKGCQSIGIAEYQANFGDWSTYPNPARRVLNLTHRGGERLAKAEQLRLYDMQGRRLLSREISGSGPWFIEVHSLSSGSYILEIGNAGHLLYRTQVMVE